jgi:WD40 repeat protein
MSISRKNWRVWLICLSVCFALYSHVPALSQTGYNIVQSVAWSPDGTRIAVGYDSGVVEIIDLITGESSVIYEVPDFSRAASVAWSPDGRLAVGNYYGSITILNGETYNVIGDLHADSDIGVHSVTWSPNGDRLAGATLSSDWREPYKVHIWDVSGPEPTEPLTTLVFYEGIGPIAWSPAGDTLAVAGYKEGVLLNTQTWQATPLGGTGVDVLAFAWSPDGSELASGAGWTSDQMVRIWTRTGTNVRSFPNNPAGALAWSPDGDYLACANDDDRLKIIDAITGNVVFTTETTTLIREIAWSPEGNWITYGDSYGNITVSVANTLLNLPFEDHLEFNTSHWLTTGNWTPDDTESHSGRHAFKDTRTEVSDYDSTLTLNWPLDLSEASAPELTYWTRYHLTEYDTGYVEVSTDDGATWQPVYQLVSTDLDWTRHRVDLSTYVGQQIRLRFRMEGADCSPWSQCPFNAEWWLDDIQVVSGESRTTVPTA